MTIPFQYVAFLSTPDLGYRFTADYRDIEPYSASYILVLVERELLPFEVGPEGEDQGVVHVGRVAGGGGIVDRDRRNSEIRPSRGCS